MPDQFSVEMESDICVVVPASEVESLEWEKVEPLADRIIKSALERTPPRVLFDLSQVQYFGSVFLSLMLRCWKQLDREQGTFAVCGANPHATEVLGVAHLDQLWSVFPDRATALQQLHRGDEG